MTIIEKTALKTLGTIINTAHNVSPALMSRFCEYLFSHPMRTRLKPWMTDYLDTSNQIELIVDDIQFSTYHWPGSGKKVLFVHGWKSNSSRWKYIIDILRNKDIDCYALDAPSHGRTKFKHFTPFHFGKMINTCIEEFEIDIVVAHSVGAFASLIQNKFYSAREVKYVLLAPTYSLELPTRVFFKILGLSKKVQYSFLKYFEDQINYTMDELSSENLVQTRASKKVQGLLIHDEEDDVLAIEGSEKIFRRSEKLDFIRTKGYGHRMQHKYIYQIVSDYILNK